jgi:hypothetical protein
MRSFLFVTLAITAFAASMTFKSTEANALAQIAPSGLREAADSTNLAQDVRWVCRRGYNGRHCWWEPNHRRNWGNRYR